MLSSTPADPDLLTLEMTESVLVHDEQRALVVLAELKDLGVQVALDDFGTGYSSLGYLEHLPIDSIKIDKKFIAHLTADPGSQVIVRAMIQMAHASGFAVVSEGVETAQQHQTVTDLGSDACQGFYFAEPMLATSIDALLGGHRSPKLRRTGPTPKCSRCRSMNALTSDNLRRTQGERPAGRSENVPRTADRP